MKLQHAYHAIRVLLLILLKRNQQYLEWHQGPLSRFSSRALAETKLVGVTAPLGVPTQQQKKNREMQWAHASGLVDQPSDYLTTARAHSRNLVLACARRGDADLANDASFARNVAQPPQARSVHTLSPSPIQIRLDLSINKPCFVY